MKLEKWTGLEQHDHRNDDREVGFYSKDNERPLKGFQQRSYIIQLYDPHLKEPLSLQFPYEE